MTNKTYYEILGISPNASEQEIKAAYRKQVKEHHPDRSDDPNADQRFKQIKKAKEVLTDNSRRAEYDQTTHSDYVQSSTDPTLVAGGTGNGDVDTWGGQTAQASSTPDTKSRNSPSQTEPTQNEPGYANTSALGSVLGNGVGLGNAGRWLFGILKQIAFGTRWVVETLWESIVAIPYGIVAFTVSLFFLAGAAYPTALYVTIPSAIIFLSIWGYMIMDWRLGVGGFGSVSLFLGLGNHIGFVPGGNGFNIIMAALLAALVLSFIMKLNYAIRGTKPPSVMDALAGWNLDDEAESTD